MVESLRWQWIGAVSNKDSSSSGAGIMAVIVVVGSNSDGFISIIVSIVGAVDACCLVASKVHNEHVESFSIEFNLTLNCGVVDGPSFAMVVK